jgi:two-component system chemotaxis response regulator CheB
MAHCPTPILIVSASTNRGELFKTYEALAAGAVDVLDKPTGFEAPGEWEGRFLAAVRMVSRVRTVTHLRARMAARVDRILPSDVEPKAGSRARAAMLAIGASTGGPGAVLELLGGLPKGFAVPILLVLHIHDAFAGAFADWLDSQTGFSVAQAVDGQPVSALAGRVAVAAAGRHLVVDGGCLRLVDGLPRHSCRPSVDVLFESVAAAAGSRAAACLLTGMGRDGAAGLLDVRRAGGLTIAQDEATSVVYGMPREAVRLGAAAHVLPIERIGPSIGALLSAREPA